MKKLFLPLLVLATLSTQAQVKSKADDTTGASNIVFTIVQQMPKFKGSLTQYLSDKIVYPEKEKRNNIEGTVYVTFVVEKDGSITGAKVLRGVNKGHALDSVALAVVAGMPAWTPGVQNGHPVRVQFNIPIHFQLKSEDDDSAHIFSIVDLKQWPTFTKSDAATYIIAHLGKSKNSKQETYVTFVVEKDGSLTGISLVSGSDTELNNEVLANVKTMGKWNPGMRNGKAVRTKFYLKVAPSQASK